MSRYSLLLLIGLPMAVQAFQGGYFHPYRTGGDLPTPPAYRDGGTTIIINTGDCFPDGREYGSPSWSGSMRDLWEAIYSADARFTVRAGDEYLVYGSSALLYASGEQRSNVMVYPEELWAILNYCYRPVSPAMGEVSMEAWFPGMESPVAGFLTVHDPAMSVIQVLLQRGREAVR